MYRNSARKTLFFYKTKRVNAYEKGASTTIHTYASTEL